MSEQREWAVKSLEWEGAPAGEERYGIHEFGYYIVTWIYPCHVVSTFTNKGAMRNIGQFKDLENAYSAAQVDYEQRIRSAIVPFAASAEAVVFGTYQERDNGVGEFRRMGEPHSPTASSYKFWTLYATPPDATDTIAALESEVARLKAKDEHRKALVQWLRDGYREMSKWTPEVAADRTRQYSLDTLSGPLASQIDEIVAERRARAALSDTDTKGGA